MVDIKTTAIDVATLTPLIIPVSMIIFYLLTFNFTWIYFVVLFLTNSGANAILKKIFSGSKFNWAKRPSSSDECCGTLKKNCGSKSVSGAGINSQSIINNINNQINKINDKLDNSFANILNNIDGLEQNALSSIDKIKDKVVSKYPSNNSFFEQIFDNIKNIISTMNLKNKTFISDINTKLPIPVISDSLLRVQSGGDAGIKGFPSGHSQTICLFATFFCIYLYTHSSSYLKFIPISIIVIVSILVMLSRKLVGCHTPLQIGVGGFIGIILGITGYIGYHYIPNYINTDVEVIQPDYTTYLFFLVSAISILFISIVIISAI